MSFFRKPTQPDSDVTSSSEQKETPITLELPWPVATQITLGIGTVAIVSLVRAGHIATQALTQLGLSSEELFRGDRLPSRPLMGHSTQDNR